jgi:hypothetical protein
MADNLPPSSADVTESGSLNLPEPSGPHRPVMGLIYLLQRDVMILRVFEHGDTERIRIDEGGRQGGFLLQFVTVFTTAYH